MNGGEGTYNKPGTVFSNRVAWTKAYLMKAELRFVLRSVVIAESQMGKTPSTLEKDR